MGSCTAGGAYVPAMSDEASSSEPGHDLPRRPAAGEGRHRRGGERRGPRRRRRAYRISGVADHLAENDPRAAHRAPHRRPISTSAKPVGLALGDRREPPTTRRDLRRHPADPRKPYDVREVIARARRRLALRRVQGALRHHPGHRLRPYLRLPVGIVANNGILFGESAQKGAHFIELCAQRGIPLLFLQNITGFMVGRKYENGGIAPRTAPRWSPPSPPPGAEVHGDHRRQLPAPATTACAAAPTRRASCGCGRTRASA